MNEFVTINPTKKKNDDQFAIIYNSLHVYVNKEKQLTKILASKSF